MADKLIPGIPHPTRIAILQQTEDDSGPENENSDITVLQQVMGSDKSRVEVIQRMECTFFQSCVRYQVHTG